MTSLTAKRRSIILSALAILALIVLAGIRLAQLSNDPQFPFLSAEAGAQWIKLDKDFNLRAWRAGLTHTVFRRRFETTATVENAYLTVRAMRQCQVILDRKPLYITTEDFDAWKQPRRIPIPSPLQPGTHELLVIVRNRNGPSVMLAYSDELGLRTGPAWQASLEDKDWTPAWPASRAKSAAISRQFPSALRALRSIWPWLLPVFVSVFAWTMLGHRFTDRLPSLKKWRPKPHHIRWAILLLWSVLAVNNMFKIPSHIGFDLKGHMEYIRYVAEKRSLPLATDGWQMFQSPLYYILSAPLYALFSSWFEPQMVIKILRIIPLLCGLIQIEIVYRAARLVFPQKHNLQIIATVVAGLMPMNTYICQVLGNEPFTGCLTSLLILMSLSLLTAPPEKRRSLFFILMGLVWGLALLSKVTPVLLLLPLVIAIIVHGRAISDSVKKVTINVALVFAAAFITSGWYYIRNWIELGKPFISGWDPARGIEWWQDPGYRTWSQLLSFGRSLTYPIYSAAVSFSDAIYSTLWLDGFLSGISIFDYRPPWNYRFMLAGALLAILPTILLFASLAAPFRKSMRQSTKPILFSIICLAIYYAAILDLNLRIPVYCMTKAHYTLGLLPCYGLLIAAGAEPFLRSRFIRALVNSAIACWAVAAYLAYFA